MVASPSTNLPCGINKQRPISVTVKGNAQVRALIHDAFLQPLDMQRATVKIYVAPVRMIVDWQHLRTQPPQELRRQLRCAAPFAQSTTIVDPWSGSSPATSC